MDVLFIGILCIYYRRNSWLKILGRKPTSFSPGSLLPDSLVSEYLRAGRRAFQSHSKGASLPSPSPRSAPGQTVQLGFWLLKLSLKRCGSDLASYNNDTGFATLTVTVQNLTRKVPRRGPQRFATML